MEEKNNFLENDEILNDETIFTNSFFNNIDTKKKEFTCDICDQKINIQLYDNHQAIHERECPFKEQYVVGLDEVGRGCFAGPVYGAAVMFDPKQLPLLRKDPMWKEIKDSKKFQIQKKKYGL